jgi:hypothetical protein
MQAEHSQMPQEKRVFLAMVKKAQKPILAFVVIFLPFGVADCTIITQTRLVHSAKKNKKLFKNPLTNPQKCGIINTSNKG